MNATYCPGYCVHGEEHFGECTAPQLIHSPAIDQTEQIEWLSKVYADASGYYVEFHRGLSSPSADKIREGIAAVLAALARAQGEVP